jgi:hypothetical protein
MHQQRPTPGGTRQNHQQGKRALGSLPNIIRKIVEMHWQRILMFMILCLAKGRNKAPLKWSIVNTFMERYFV